MMNKNLIPVSTSEAPAAIGPYSQAIIANGILYASGQIPVNPSIGEVDGTDISTQTLRVMKNIDAVLKTAGTDFESVVSTTCFLADMNDFAEFNRIYAEYFVSKPARCCVAAKQLPKNVLCEIGFTALV